MEALKCVCCGNNDFETDNEFYICKYCGTKYPKKIKDKITVDESPKFDNYITIARRAKDDENYDKSEEYYKKALEINPNSWEAYFFSGEYKPKSLINLIKAHVSENERHSVIQTITEYICALSKYYCHWKGDECIEIADLIISNFDNEEESALKLYIFMYTDAYHYSEKNLSSATEDDVKILDKKDWILEKIHKIDPTYESPKIIILEELERRRQENERIEREKQEEQERIESERIEEEFKQIKKDIILVFVVFCSLLLLALLINFLT